MRFRTTLITMIVAAGCVSGMFYMMRLDTSPGRANATIATLSLASMLPINEIDRISLQREGEPELVYERFDGVWMQVEPFPFRMDPFSIRQLAMIAMQLERELEIVEVQVDDGDLASRGFDPPRATIRYQWRDESLALELGRLVGAGRGYLRIKGQEQIYAVDQSLHQRAIRMDPKEWRDRRIFHDVSINAVSIERVAANDHMLLAVDRKQWKMHKPIETRVSSVSLTDLLQAMDSVRMGGFVSDQPDSLASFGLENPVATMAITTSRPVETDGEIQRVQETQRLLVGERTGGGTNDRYAMIEGVPVVFRLTNEAQSSLFIKTELMIDHTATGILPSDVKSIRIAYPDDDLLLEKDLDRWIAPEYGEIAVQVKYVETLLRQLTTLRPHAVAIQMYPVELEVCTITMFGYDGRPLDTVRVAHNEKTGQWIMENGDNVLRIFSENVELKIMPKHFGLESSLP